MSTSSAVMGSTVREALAEVSTEWVEVVEAEKGLPAGSAPETVRSKEVCAARSVPAASMRKVRSAATVPL